METHPDFEGSLNAGGHRAEILSLVLRVCISTWAVITLLVLKDGFVLKSFKKSGMIEMFEEVSALQRFKG